jgi:hypothetical protein
MLAHLAGGVPVEGRSEGPPIAHPQGPVVPRVVVAVARKDVERHPPEQLRQVISDPLGQGVHAVAIAMPRKSAPTVSSRPVNVRAESLVADWLNAPG